MTTERTDDARSHGLEIAAPSGERARGWGLVGSWLVLAIVSWLVTGALVSGVVWFARWFASGT